MFNVVVFTRNRPMQLRAYIESLLFCSGLDPSQIIVFAHDTTDYASIISDFPSIRWWTENGENFGKRLRDLYAELNPLGYTLFGCDDVVYIRQFVPQNVVSIMQRYGDGILGFVLRVGTSNKEYGAPQSGLHLCWKWFTLYGHGEWGYPFELMASVYRNSLIKEILDTGQLLRNPNDLEAFGSTYVGKSSKYQKTLLAMFNTPSYAVAQDVNRVQTLYPNKVAGGKEHDSAHLIELEKQGKRLDWTNLFGITPDSPFVGKEYWKIV